MLISIIKTVVNTQGEKTMNKQNTLNDFARGIIVILLVCCIIYKIYAFIDLNKGASPNTDQFKWALERFFSLVSEISIPLALIFIVRRIDRE